MIAGAVERFDEFIVPRAPHKSRRRGVCAFAAVDVVAAVDAAVVEDHNGDRQMVAADSFYLHSTEAERAVALDGDDRLAAHDGSADGIAHADTHHSPRSAVETFARLVHVDDVTTDIERV